MCIGAIFAFYGYIDFFRPSLLLSWMLEHFCLETCCFGCLICLCVLFVCKKKKKQKRKKNNNSNKNNSHNNNKMKHKKTDVDDGDAHTASDNKEGDVVLRQLK